MIAHLNNLATLAEVHFAEFPVFSICLFLQVLHEINSGKNTTHFPSNA
jgi:hypothetical protein